MLESGKDAAVAGGKGRLVQWISRERPKEISNLLESRERSPVWEREWCGVWRGRAVCVPRSAWWLRVTH